MCLCVCVRARARECMFIHVCLSASISLSLSSPPLSSSLPLYFPCVPACLPAVQGYGLMAVACPYLQALDRHYEGLQTELSQEQDKQGNSPSTTLVHSHAPP